MQLISHEDPQSRVVIDYKGIVLLPAARLKDAPDRPEKVQFELVELPHMELTLPVTDDTMRLVLQDISAIQVSEPTASEKLWRVWFWLNEHFDNNSYFTSKSSAQQIILAWLNR